VTFICDSVTRSFAGITARVFLLATGRLAVNEMLIIVGVCSTSTKWFSTYKRERWTTRCVLARHPDRLYDAAHVAQYKVLRDDDVEYRRRNLREVTPIAVSRSIINARSQITTVSYGPPPITAVYHG
jgi:hypothetical protein